ncbi:hypothetical protein BJV85_003363 [Clostridium acetobutylicum]|uniref:hypothetical protein n=1 Tax=Clostridium TaxID=1485 RepID=UPI00149491FB|nr:MULTISPECIES: hypothetical protein [Clostridium]NOV89454.1 hypothetical protein [Clostridium acetobutylicum]NOW16016.1 hypothetical protein [Clostridium acetobutylicum]NRY57695.1 hypothetical protein [Clostridium acetobutylicum]NSA94440.1 hypothetical protein [Clostridium acetobutylicum]NYC95594.1 hypothetical protein [Clostridium acetobutylicum]
MYISTFCLKPKSIKLKIEVDAYTISELRIPIVRIESGITKDAAAKKESLPAGIMVDK